MLVFQPRLSGSETGQMMSKFAHQEKIKKINPSLRSPATVRIWIIRRRK